MASANSKSQKHSITNSPTAHIQFSSNSPSSIQLTRGIPHSISQNQITMKPTSATLLLSITQAAINHDINPSTPFSPSFAFTPIHKLNHLSRNQSPNLQIQKKTTQKNPSPYSQFAVSQAVPAGVSSLCPSDAAPPPRHHVQPSLADLTLTILCKQKKEKKI
jgi:hypothetical protein